MSNDAKPKHQWHKPRIPLIHVPCQSCKNQGNVKKRTGRIKNNNHKVAHKPAETERNFDFSKVNKSTLFITMTAITIIHQTRNRGIFKSEVRNTAELLQGKFYEPFLIVTSMLQNILLAM
jgi:hypothetical protein